jgi:hypothetical protein
MRIIIVGGGITGIASALYAKKLGFRNIFLFEKTNAIGGILKDLNINSEISFLRNCQYFASNSPIFNVIDKNLFYEFRHSCGNYSDFDGEIIVRDDFAGPTFDLSGVDISMDIDLAKDDVNSYFSSYPLPIKRGLNKLFMRIADSRAIHYSCLFSLQLQRVFVQDKVKQILNLKSASPYHDKLYGLPRRILELDDSYSCLPIGGFDKLFSKVYKDLVDLDIKIKFSTNLTPIFENNSFSLKIKDEVINSDDDLVVWTADPNKFLLMEENSLGYKPLKMKNYYFKINNFINIPFYIQVFDVKTPILRIFIYENSVVVEALANKETEKNIFSQVKNIVSKFYKKLINKEIEPEDIFCRKETRFNIFGPDIFKKLKDLNENYFDRYNLLFTPWHKYGRDLRIEDIFEKLRLVKEKY